MKCPTCSHDMQAGAKFCPECGQRQPVTTVPPSAPASALEALPFFLAAPLAEYFETSTDRHPKLKLWDACDAVEMLLRLIVMIGVAEHQRSGGMPEDLLQELRQRVERPTLGQWRRMAEDLFRSIPQEDATFPELKAFLIGDLLPFLGDAREQSPETSFNALRNQLAHGGGLTEANARMMLTRWAGPFEAFLEKTSFLGLSSLAVRMADNSFGEIRGPSGRPGPLPVEVKALLANQSEGSVFLVRAGRALLLWPLAHYGELLIPGRDSSEGVATPQAYSRTQSTGLQFTALANDWACQAVGDERAWTAFHALFRLREEKATTAFQIKGFEGEIQKDAHRVVGRGAEIARLAEILGGTPEGLVWIGGQAGIGKSWILAKVVSEILDQPPQGALVLPFRFKVGDDRCSRQTFLTFAIERLEAWDGLVKPEEEKPCKDGKPLEQLKALLQRVAEDRRVVFVLDGLDEIASRDPRFTSEVTVSLALPWVLWACAGREEAGLPEIFRKAQAIEPWPDGLPRMTEGDIHEMLLESLDNHRKRLIQGDREEGGRVINRFVQRVAERAEGLPIYVRYVVGDVLARRISPEATAALPPSLAAYHEAILERYGISDLAMVLQPLVGALAIAREPLSTATLADLLARRDESLQGPRGNDLVHQSLSRIGAMISRRPTPDGEDGFTLFHKSFRDHVLTSPRTRKVAESAGLAMAKAALAPGRPMDAPAACYLFRNGVAHMVEAGWHTQALRLLTEFPYLMARLQALQPGGAEGLGADWTRVLSEVAEADPDTRIWAAFFWGREHILRRGEGAWPAYKILLQLAIEHADDSPVTRQAEAWLGTNESSWLWFRNPWRPTKLIPDPCLRVLEGHTSPVWGVRVLAAIQFI